MDNAWYYTLSTIAQTLAAIFGLAAVFVIIRLQNIIEKLKEYKKRAYYLVKKKNDHLHEKSLRISERTVTGLYKDLHEIEIHYQEIYEKNSGINEDFTALSAAFEPNLKLDNLTFLKDTVDNFKTHRDQREKLVKTVKAPGIITSATIAYVILLLGMSNLFCCDRILAELLFLLAITLSIASIFLMVKTSWKLLKDSGQKI